MEMLDIMFVLMGIFQLGVTLYSVYLIISSVLESRKDKEKIDAAYIVPLLIVGILFAILTYKSFDFAYHYIIEIPRQLEAEEREKEAEEKEEEAYREYISENGVYENEDSEVIVVAKDKNYKYSGSRRYSSSSIDYVVVLEDSSGDRDIEESKSLYYDVEIGDIVIKRKVKVKDKNNGDLLEVNGPYYYKKESK